MPVITEEWLKIFENIQLDAVISTPGVKFYKKLHRKFGWQGKMLLV